MKVYRVTTPSQVFTEVRKICFEQEHALVPAWEGLTRLTEVCLHKTGQGYKVRALLYSLWNGQPASLLEVVSLDWQIRRIFWP